MVVLARFLELATQPNALEYVREIEPASHAHIFEHAADLANVLVRRLGRRVAFDHPCTIEVWSDSFVVDDKDVFWRAYLELGLPTLVAVGDDAYAPAGTYGTRHVEFCRIHAFDENDRQPQVFLAQVQFAMQQMWSDPV